MDVLTFRGVGYAVIGLLLFTMLIVTLVSMRKEARDDDSLRGLFWMTLFVLALSAFVALSSAYITARSFQKLGPRLQTRVVLSGSDPQ